MPRLECEHRELRIFWFLALLSHVALDGFSITSITDSPYVVAIGPEFTSPELSFDRRDFERAFGGQTFDQADDGSNSIFWQALAENVNMVLIKANFIDVDCEAFLESSQYFFDHCDDFRLKNIAPVLDRQLDVVVTLGDIVIPTPEIILDVCHDPIVSVCCHCCLGKLR